MPLPFPVVLAGPRGRLVLGSSASPGLFPALTASSGLDQTCGLPGLPAAALHPGLARSSKRPAPLVLASSAAARLSSRTARNSHQNIPTGTAQEWGIEGRRWPACGAHLLPSRVTARPTRPRFQTQLRSRISKNFKAVAGAEPHTKGRLSEPGACDQEPDPTSRVPASVRGPSWWASGHRSLPPSLLTQKRSLHSSTHLLQSFHCLLSFYFIVYRFIERLFVPVTQRT